MGNLPAVEVHILVEDQHEVLEAVDVALVRVNLKSAFPVVQSNDEVAAAEVHILVEDQQSVFEQLGDSRKAGTVPGRYPH